MTVETEHSKSRLCEVILGNRIRTPDYGATAVSIVMPLEDLTPDILLRAQEAIWVFSPIHVRLMMPVVLDLIEENDAPLLQSGYVDAFLLHVNHDFYLSPKHESTSPVPYLPRQYSSRYQQHRVTPTVSGMNSHEQAWALDWATDLLQKVDLETLASFQTDLTMLCRILAMALGKSEDEAAAFRPLK